MSAIDQTDANNLINATLGTAPYTAVTAVHVRLGVTTAPTSTSDMPQLTGSTYVTNGYAVTWNAASSGSTSSITTESILNSTGSNWVIIGIEVWDVAGTPLRHWFGVWTSEPITISNGSSFAWAAGAIVISLS